MMTYILATWDDDIRIRSNETEQQKSGPRVNVHEIAPEVVYRDSLVTVTAER